MTSRRFLMLLLAALPVAPLHAGGKKDSQAKISFHIQADRNENPKMIFPQLTNGRQLFYRRMSEVNERDIANFNPFPSRDGEGFGLLLQLKPGAINRINAVTTENINRWMVAMVNGRVVDAVFIEKPVNDGQLVIWKGIGAGEIQALDKKFPRIGEKKPRL